MSRNEVGREVGRDGGNTFFNEDGRLAIAEPLGLAVVPPVLVLDEAPILICVCVNVA